MALRLPISIFTVMVVKMTMMMMMMIIIVKLVVLFDAEAFEEMRLAF